MVVKNASGNEAWRPDENSPESAYEGRQPLEDTLTDDPVGQRTRPTGGMPSSPDKGVGPEASRADKERRRDAGGAPSERE